MHPQSIQAARARLEMYDLCAEILLASAADLESSFVGRTFDMVLFTASLEHMTLDERIRAVQSSWRMVQPGGLWGLVETPNRLWWFDGHTSGLPFFNWLPDELAFQCARMSSRRGFGDIYRDLTQESMLAFLRRGRGVSYHELAVALDSDFADIESDRASFLRQKRPLLGYGIRRRLDRRYHAFLRAACPDIPPALLMEYLDVLIRKPSAA